MHSWGVAVIMGPIGIPPNLLLAPFDFRCQKNISRPTTSDEQNGITLQVRRRLVVRKPGGFKATTTTTENGRKGGQAAMHTPLSCRRRTGRRPASSCSRRKRL